MDNSILILFWRQRACDMTVPQETQVIRRLGRKYSLDWQGEGSWAKTKFRSKANSIRTWLLLRIKYCLFTSLIVDLILHRDIHI